MSRPAIDLGNVSNLKRKIEQNENIIKEITENIDSLMLKLTHDNKADFVQRQRVYNELKNERARVRYFERDIERLKGKLSMFQV